MAKNDELDSGALSDANGRDGATAELDSGALGDANARDGTAGTTCFDGEQNGEETGVDCGGVCSSCGVGSFDCAAVTTIPQVECEALVAFYMTTGGDSWTDNTGWLSDPDPCRWTGVFCGAGRVSTIRLNNNGLRGSITSQVGSLTALTTLNLNSNELSGNIPAELGNLLALADLSLGWNQLTGGIPTELADLPLRSFYLNSNQLSGSIPAELGALGGCDAFRLDDNQLAGEVPSSLMSVPGTFFFWLRGQTGCLTITGNPAFETWVSNKDFGWNDGCP